MERIRICTISLMLAATAISPVISGCSGPGTPPAPLAPESNFSGTPTSGLVGLMGMLVDFSDNSSGGPADSWSWTFGDGGISSLKDPSHSYATAGNYDVSLSVTGPGGSSTLSRPGYIFVAVQPVLVLSKHRDPLTNRVEPVLSDRATADPVGSAPTDFDYREVDSPSVIEDPSRVPIFGDRFLLFYEGTDALLNYVIAVVSSTEEDLDVLVIDRTVVMSPASMPPLNDNGTLIAPYGAGDPTVIVDHSVMVDNAGRYQMWFEGTFGVNAFSLQSAILTCSSQDGITWTAPIFCTGLEPGALFGTVVRVADPSVLKTNEPSDAFRMAFEVVRTDGSSVIGMAFSDDGIDWTIRDGVFNGPPAAPSFSGGPGTFDDFAVHAPTIAIEQDRSGNLIEWMLFYEGARSGTDNDTVIGYATSPDGYSWSGFHIPVLEPSSDLVAPPLFDSDDLKQPAVIQPNNYPGTDINGIPYPRFLL